MVSGRFRAARAAVAGLALFAGAPVPARVIDWHGLATADDRQRLRGWRSAWTEARAGQEAAIAAEGTLFDPDRVLADPVPPPGLYRCRVFKLGARGTAMHRFTTYPDFKCRIDMAGGQPRFTKLDGAQRPGGLLYPTSDARAIFLGSLMLSDETERLRYGADALRDVAGYIEHVDAARWRLVLPRPRFESVLDVIELVPAG